MPSSAVLGRFSGGAPVPWAQVSVLCGGLSGWGAGDSDPGTRGWLPRASGPPRPRAPPAPSPAPAPQASAAARRRAGRRGASSLREQRTQRKAPQPGPPRSGAEGRRHPPRVRGVPRAGRKGRAARAPPAGGGSEQCCRRRSPRPENRSSSRSPDTFEKFLLETRNLTKQKRGAHTGPPGTQPLRPSAPPKP